MFEVFAEKYFDEIRAFRTMDEGRRWLDAPGRSLDGGDRGTAVGFLG